MTTQFTFNVGDRVRKKTGDYTFNGVVVAVFFKRDSTLERVCVENDQGLIHIFSPAQLELVK